MLPSRLGAWKLPSNCAQKPLSLVAGEESGCRCDRERERERDIDMKFMGPRVPRHVVDASPPFTHVKDVRDVRTYPLPLRGEIGDPWDNDVMVRVLLPLRISLFFSTGVLCFAGTSHARAIVGCLYMYVERERNVLVSDDEAIPKYTSDMPLSLSLSLEPPSASLHVCVICRVRALSRPPT